jgi:hypothetical protein
MRRHALRLFTALLTVALLAPGASPVAAAYTPVFVDDASPWGNCHSGDGANYTYGHFNCDGMPDQTQLDQSNAVNGYPNANWYDLAGGQTDRPYVKSLAVKNGDSVTTIISDGTVSTTMGATAGNIGVVLVPFNLCDSDRTPPQTTNCYSTPNRIGVYLAYRKGFGTAGHNFTRPNDGNISGPADIALKDNEGGALTIDENTEIQLEVNLNSIGKSLRWTWMNGIPSYWATHDLGTDAASFTVHAKLAKMPIIDNFVDYDTHLCTTVPISSCSVSRSNSDWLELQMVLSLDSTMSESMTGALFATEGAIMGSVEVATDTATGLPILKYGAASSHYLHTGDTAEHIRYGRMHAVIPASALVQQLGVPSFTDGSAVPAAATPSAVFTTVREGSCGAGCSDGDTTFTEWTSGTQGTDGILVDIVGITFSAPKFKVAPKSGALKAPSAKLSGSTYKITVASGSTSSSLSTVNGICKSKGCTVKLFKASTSKLSSVLTYVSRTTSAKGKNVSIYFNVTRKTTGSSAAKVQRGTRYVVVVTRNDTGALVSSAPVVLP